MKPRSPRKAETALNEAREMVIESGDVPIPSNEWDAAEAALDGQPKDFIADIISGKAEGPYKPTSSWRRVR